MDKLRSFYYSKPWRDLSFKLKIERGGKCERTGEIFTDMSKLIAHHKVALTENNVDDVNISLNPELIEIISHSEHNKEHRRFGNKQNIYIIWGSPLSGKTTLAKELCKYGDIVLDIDRLWQAVSFQAEYVKPNNIRFNVFALRDNLLEQIKMRYGNWYDAYVIMSLPDKYERERLVETLGAELIYCESTQAECLERRVKSGKPKEWDKYINDWFDEYTE